MVAQKKEDAGGTCQFRKMTLRPVSRAIVFASSLAPAPRGLRRLHAYRYINNGVWVPHLLGLHALLVTPVFVCLPRPANRPLNMLMEPALIHRATEADELNCKTLEVGCENNWKTNGLFQRRNFDGHLNFKTSLRWTRVGKYGGGVWTEIVLFFHWQKKRSSSDLRVRRYKTRFLSLGCGCLRIYDEDEYKCKNVRGGGQVQGDMKLKRKYWIPTLEDKIYFHPNFKWNI